MYGGRCPESIRSCRRQSRAEGSTRRWKRRTNSSSKFRKRRTDIARTGACRLTRQILTCKHRPAGCPASRQYRTWSSPPDAMRRRRHRRDGRSATSRAASNRGIHVTAEPKTAGSARGLNCIVSEYLAKYVDLDLRWCTPENAAQGGNCGSRVELTRSGPQPRVRAPWTSTAIPSRQRQVDASRVLRRSTTSNVGQCRQHGVDDIDGHRPKSRPSSQ